jgi:UDP-N-acetylmuramoyl-L-alanyl-D-glutamate--2,6-diaminopimelate ligase
MSGMRLSQLTAGLPLHATIDADPEITAVTADSRAVTPGALFVAVRGETVDGHRFVAEAVARGAAAVVVERPVEADVPVVRVTHAAEALAWLAAAFHGYPARQLVMIGVTGTDGKTTTSTLIHAILRAAGLEAGLISTVGAVIGDQTLDTGFHVTTPDAPALQGYLARMVAAGFTHCVLETTSHGWDQRRTDACEFDVAVITNITHEHLDYHKTFENYQAAKARLFESLRTAALKPGVAKRAVVNHDDPSAELLRAAAAPVPAVSYALQAEAEVRARGLRFTPAAMHFTASGPGFTVTTLTRLVGVYNVANALAAITATVGALGISPEVAAAGIASLAGVPGRMERIALGQPFTAIVDFAHTPNALRRALEAGRELAGSSARSPGGRVIAVFGSAGLRDVEKRRMMAETSAELADVTVLTAEDPRTESLDDILEMMAFGARSKGALEGQTLFRVPDRGEAIRLAVRLARPGDVVLACGKGHEQSMAFGDVEYAWDDRVALRAALSELLGAAGPPMPTLPTAGG